MGRGIDDVAILTLTLSAEDLTANDLTRITRALQTEVAKTEDVGLTYLVGDAQDAIRIEPDPDRLALYGVTLQQLAGKVAQANRTLNTGACATRADGGSGGGGDSDGSIRSGEPSIDDAGRAAGLCLGRGRGAVRGEHEGRHRLASGEGCRGGAGGDAGGGEAGGGQCGRCGRGGDAPGGGSGAEAVARGRYGHCDARLWRDGEREGKRVAVPPWPCDRVDHRAGLARHRLARGRGGPIVIPVTILLTLFAAWVMGFTLNRVSLFALIFSIGILVDDAIVVIENIDRHWGMDRRKPRLQAAIEAVAEVGNPTIVATLTVVVALLPMLFVSGLMGPYMSPIPANASAAMIFSFFVAVIITPWLMVRSRAGRTCTNMPSTTNTEATKAAGWSGATRQLPNRC